MSSRGSMRSSRDSQGPSVSSSCEPQDSRANQLITIKMPKAFGFPRMPPSLFAFCATA